MSQENVELVRRVNEAFNRADVAAMLECLDPDGVWWPRADDLEVESVRGHDAIAARFADMDASVKLRAQAAVNEEQIVIAAEVTVDPGDFGHLQPIVDAASEELEQAGVSETPADVLADAGYWHKV